MPTVNPSAVIVDYDTDKPMKFGVIEDAASRAVVNGIRSRLAKAPAEDKPAIEEELNEAMQKVQPVLTVGRASIEAVKNPLPDKDSKDKPENLSGAEKMDLDDFGIRLRVAAREGVDAVATFSNKELETIKDRVNRAWPSPTVVAQVFRAIKDDEKKAETVAAAA